VGKDQEIPERETFLAPAVLLPEVIMPLISALLRVLPIPSSEASVTFRRGADKIKGL
jgi:hypothetical protein